MQRDRQPEVMDQPGLDPAEHDRALQGLRRINGISRCVPGLFRHACWLAEMGSALALSATPAVPAVVMIGPEGGFVPFELELAQAVIAQPVHLGTRVLSVDTALTAALALGWG